MASEQKSSGGFPIVTIIIGLALMFGGFYVSKNVHIGFIEQLRETGIPLDPGKTVATIGVLLILFPVVKFFYLNPLADAINARTQSLERTFSEAEDLRAEMTRMKADYEQRLVATEASAREQIQAQIREAQQLRTQLMAEAHAQADEFKRKAQEEISIERDKALAQVRLNVVNLTLNATEKLLGESMDDDRNRRLVQEFIDREEALS